MTETRDGRYEGKYGGRTTIKYKLKVNKKKMGRIEDGVRLNISPFGKIVHRVEQNEVLVGVFMTDFIGLALSISLGSVLITVLVGIGLRH